MTMAFEKVATSQGGTRWYPATVRTVYLSEKATLDAEVVTATA